MRLFRIALSIFFLFGSSLVIAGSSSDYNLDFPLSDKSLDLSEKAYAEKNNKSVESLSLLSLIHI